MRQGAGDKQRGMRNRAHGAAALAAALSMAIVAAGCAPSAYLRGRYPGPFARLSPYPSHYAIPEMSPTSAVGRWDTVMLLPAGTPVQVLTFDGRKPAGDVTSVDGATLRLVTPSGEIALARADVMRVDRLPPPSSREYREAAGRGAAVGLGVVGIIGLIAGHMPPARVFAAGAITGAGSGIQDASCLRGAVTIYLAPSRVRQPGPPVR